VVALIINGTTYCTGSLTNNTARDGTPYLLTATHCLNGDYDAQFLAIRRYDMIAGTIVAFFHYDSPLCSTDIRGPLQMTMASADSVRNTPSQWRDQKGSNRRRFFIHRHINRRKIDVQFTARAGSVCFAQQVLERSRIHRQPTIPSVIT